MTPRQQQFARDGFVLERVLTDAEIGRIRAPIGVDIGAQTPPEIAVSTIAGSEPPSRSGAA